MDGILPNLRQLDGVPGVARADQWRNLTDSFFCYITKKVLHNLWKCFTVKYALRYPRKAPVPTQNAHACKKKKTAS